MWRNGDGARMKELTRSDFTYDDGAWLTTVVLPAWAGFQSRRGPYGAQDSATASDGTVTITVMPEADNAPLGEPELSRVRYLVQEAAAIQRSILEVLLARYPSIRQDYAGYAAAEDLPMVFSTEGFRALVGLHSIHLYNLEKDGLPYAGFELGCAWDEEHGLGAMLNGARVVKFGGADTAILLWIAEKDAEGR
jgi:hypothetical protein